MPGPWSRTVRTASVGGGVEFGPRWVCPEEYGPRTLPSRFVSTCINENMLPCTHGFGSDRFRYRARRINNPVVGDGVVDDCDQA